MSEIIKNKYLDFDGLSKYDGLIKNFIKSGDSELSNAIAALDAKIGELNVEGSDDKNLAEIVEGIYASIAEIVEKQESLDGNDATLEGKINDIVGDLESLGEGVNQMTLVEIANKLKEVDGSISKNTQDIVNIKDRVSSLEKTIEDLGAIEGGENIATIISKVNDNVVAIETLKGEGEGSVKKIAADAVAAVVADADSDFDTLKEVADWIASDKEGSAALQTTVSGHTDSINTINGELDALEEKVDQDIANLTTHMTEAAQTLGEVDSRLDALEAFEETHEYIPISEIEGLFA